MKNLDIDTKFFYYSHVKNNLPLKSVRTEIHIVLFVKLGCKPEWSNVYMYLQRESTYTVFTSSLTIA